MVGVITTPNGRIQMGRAIRPRHGPALFSSVNFGNAGSSYNCKDMMSINMDHFSHRIFTAFGASITRTFGVCHAVRTRPGTGEARRLDRVFGPHPDKAVDRDLARRLDKSNLLDDPGFRSEDQITICQIRGYRGSRLKNWLESCRIFTENSDRGVSSRQSMSSRVNHLPSIIPKARESVTASIESAPTRR
jgi:hypothetical protein